MQDFYNFQQISRLCYHQELACTPKDPPRWVDMNEISLICFHKRIDWVIDKTVCKPTLSDPFENRIFVSWYIWDFAFGHYFGCYLSAGGRYWTLFERDVALFRLFMQKNRTTEGSPRNTYNWWYHFESTSRSPPGHCRELLFNWWFVLEAVC